MASFILKYRLSELNLSDQYEVSSAALESSTAGEDIYDKAKEQLDLHHIPYTPHKAHKLTMSEYLGADYVLVMELYQKIEIRRNMSSSCIGKVHTLLEYASNTHDIEDPFYTRDFAKAFEEINEGINSFIKEIIAK